MTYLLIIHLRFPNHPRSPGDYKKVHVFLLYKLQNRSTEYVESLQCAYYCQFSTHISCIYLYVFNLQYMWVGPVVLKSKWSFLFMHNWITVYLRQRGSKQGVAEYVVIFHG